MTLQGDPGSLAYVDRQLGRKAALVVGGRRVSVPFARIDDLAWLADGSRLVLFAAKLNTGALGSSSSTSTACDPTEAGSGAYHERQRLAQVGR